MDNDGTGLTIAQAAARLGITAAAVRKRVRRGSLQAYKAGGTWRVVLPPGRTGTGTGTGAGYDAGQARSRPRGIPLRDELVEQLRTENDFLRRLTEFQAGQLAELQRQLVAPTAQPEPPATMPTEAPERPLTRRRRPPWWQRLWQR